MTALNRTLASVEAARDALTAGKRDDAARGLVRAAEQHYLSALEAQGAERGERLETAIRIARLALELRRDNGGRPTQARRERTTGDDDGLTDFAPVERPATRFIDVVGLEEAKRAIDLALVRPLKHPESAQRFRLKPGGGVLLFGPPGTGKTLLGRAVAGEVDAPFYYVKPSDVMSQWVGQAERNIAKLFTQARRHARAVIFIDEVESLVPSRVSTRSTVMARVVPQILAEVEGFEGRPRGLMFIGATNRPEKIDEAMLRPGRFDRKIYVGPPALSDRVALFERHLSGRDVEPDIDFRALAIATEGYTGADIATICEEAARRAFEAATSGEGRQRKVQMADLLQEIERSQPSVSAATIHAHEAFMGTR